MKEYKLYDKLLGKISPETKLSISDSFRKNRPALVPIPYIHIPFIQNNPSTCSSLPFLSYKFLSFLSTPEFKKSIIEIEENDNINSNIKIQSLSPQ